MARIVFMGTPEFAVPVLERLLADEHEVVAIYTRPDRPAGRGRQLQESPVKRAATAHGLPVVQPRSLRRPEEIERLRQLRPDVVVVAAYGLILPPAVLEIPPGGCVNLHPSLLPRHRGPAPVAGTLLAGDEEAGVTIMRLDAGTDTGDILVQRAVPILPDDTTGTLTARLAAIGAELLAEVLPLWLVGRVVPRPQDDAQATYTQQMQKQEGEINWNRPAVEIARPCPADGGWGPTARGRAAASRAPASLPCLEVGR